MIIVRLLEFNLDFYEQSFENDWKSVDTAVQVIQNSSIKTFLQFQYS
jgi:hypothetical protein